EHIVFDRGRFVARLRVPDRRVISEAEGEGEQHVYGPAKRRGLGRFSGWNACHPRFGLPVLLRGVERRDPAARRTHLPGPGIPRWDERGVRSYCPGVSRVWVATAIGTIELAQAPP